jgi:hypothetical protein
MGSQKLNSTWGIDAVNSLNFQCMSTTSGSAYYSSVIKPLYADINYVNTGS